MKFWDHDDPDPDAVIELDNSKERPYCPTHFCYMTCRKSTPNTRTYMCPVPGCTAEKKVIRPQLVMPRQPETCPVCSKGKKQVFCEVDHFRRFSVILKCPKCSYTAKLDRPDIQRQIARFNRERPHYRS